MPAATQTACGNSGTSRCPQVFGEFSSTLFAPHGYVFDPELSKATMANPTVTVDVVVLLPATSHREMANSYVWFVDALKAPDPELPEAQDPPQLTHPEPSPFCSVRLLLPLVTRKRRSSA